MCGILEQNVQDTWTMGEKPSVLVSCFVEWQALDLSTDDLRNSETSIINL
jgi:hypothetical protein